MSQPARAPRPPVDDTDIKVRNRRMLMVGGVMALLAFVVAAGYWYTHQPGKAASPPTALAIVNVGGSLVVGSNNAPHHLVVKESFDCSTCATFERSVQTFLHADAAAGVVQIRYVIPTGGDSAYDEAVASNPKSALAYHDRRFTTENPRSAGSLVVTVDGKQPVDSHGKPITDPVSLANYVETALAR